MRGFYIYTHSLSTVWTISFSNLSRKHCGGANVARKCVHFVSVHFDQQPAIKYIQF